MQTEFKIEIFNRFAAIERCNLIMGWIICCFVIFSNFQGRFPSSKWCWIPRLLTKGRTSDFHKRRFVWLSFKVTRLEHWWKFCLVSNVAEAEEEEKLAMGLKILISILLGTSSDTIKRIRAKSKISFLDLNKGGSSSIYTSTHKRKTRNKSVK